MATIDLALLGGFEARRGQGGPLVLPTRKAQALLAYLAFPPVRAHSREHLTALLWGDTPERQGRHSLRQALLEVRRALAPDEDTLIIADADQVALSAGACGTDVTAFERAVKDGSPEALERAGQLYRGDLLEGLALREAPFEDWLVPERERLRELALGALGHLLALHERAGRDDIAIRTAQRLLAIDALQEPVHRTLMRLYARQDRRAAALRQYQLCLAVLRRELGVEPEARTTELYRELLAPGVRAPASSRRAPQRRSVASRGGRVADTPLVGREREMASALALLDRAWTTDGIVALVRGEAGIGKSRLLEELSAEAVRRGGRVLLGRCYETEQILPFRPWIDALRDGDVLGDLEVLVGLSPTARLRLARVLPELHESASDTGSSADDRGPLFEAMADLVAALAGRQPLVVVLEDVQWADETSVRLLSFIGRRLGQHHLLIAATVRDEDAPEAGVLTQALSELGTARRLEEIRLQPLAADDTLSLVRALGHLRPAEVEAVGRRVWAISGGNPFVIVETMRTLQETPVASGGVPLPRTVRDSVAARLARLSVPAQHLLAVAAVIGREFGFGLLQRAAGATDRETAAGVEEMIRRRVFSAVGERFQFDHDRIREVALDRLLPAVRQSLHAAVAEALEALDPEGLAELSDRLAVHWVNADVPDRAVRALMLFADTARRRYALDEALRALDQALGFVERLPAADRERRRLEVLVRTAWVLSVLGRFREILTLLSPHAGEVERLGDPALAASYHFRLGLTYCYLGDLTRAAGAEERAIAEARRCGAQETLGQAHYALALRACWLGEIRDGIEHGREAVACLGGSRDWQALSWWVLGLNYMLAGAFDQALEAEAEVEAIARTLGEARLASFAAYATARIFTTMGEWERAIEAGRRAVDVARDPIATFAATLFLGAAYAEKGDADEAIPRLEAAVERFERFGLKHTLAIGLHHLTEARLLAGDRAKARDLAERALSVQQELGSRWGVAGARQLLARVALADGARDQAVALALEALAAHDAVAAPFEAGRDHLLLAELAAERGDRSALEAHLRAAHRTFAALRVPRYVGRARRLAERAGVALGPA